jgi:hypothetical protein
MVIPSIIEEEEDSDLMQSDSASSRLVFAAINEDEEDNWQTDEAA